MFIAARLGVLLSLLGPFLAIPSAPAAAQTQEVTIRAIHHIQFDTSKLTVTADGSVTVHFINEEFHEETGVGMFHNFAVYTDSTATELVVPGSIAAICEAHCSEDIQFDLPSPGTYFFRCDVHPSVMTGEFNVVAPVGGLSRDLDADEAALVLETPDSTGTGAGVLASVIAAATAGAIALGGAAWYARRRKAS